MHNEASVVAGVVTELQTAFPVVVCVDDGSTDDSAAVARAAGAVVVPHPTNLGQGAALETGIRFALSLPATEYVVTFDADGQHDVADARAMVERAVYRDLQVVLGSRFLDASKEVPFGRRLLLNGAVRFTRQHHGAGADRRPQRAAGAAPRRRRVGAAPAARHGPRRARSSPCWPAAASRVEEHPVTIRYTDYSRAKGQRGYNALNILFELAVNRMRAAA